MTSISSIPNISSSYFNCISKQDIAIASIKLGSIFQRLFFKSTEIIFESVILKSKIQDRLYDHCYRWIKATLGLILSGSSIPFYFVGGLFLFLGDTFNDHPYILKTNHTIQSQPSNSIKLATFNICCFDGGFPYLFGGLDPAFKRVDRIAEEILNLKSDIVAIQEANDTTTEKLIEKFKEEYSECYYHIGSSPVFFSSGIVLFSKIPIISEPLYIPYPHARFLKRGFFVFETEKFNGIITHLTPGKEQNTYRKIEIGLILEHVKKEQNKKPFVLMGDFNSERPMEVEGFFDSMGDDKPVTATNRFNERTIIGKKSDDLDDESIDAILFNKSGSNPKILNWTLVDTFDINHMESAISDHKLLSLELEIN